MTVQALLQALGITQPPVSTPAAACVAFVRTGKLVFNSGHIAQVDAQAPGAFGLARLPTGSRVEIELIAELG